jgi:putative membrane protein
MKVFPNLLIAGAATLTLVTAGAAQETKAAPLTDADIAAIVVAANAIDAEAGEVAAAKAASAAVKEFARTMTRDHRAVNEQAGQLVQKLGVTPTENAITKSLWAGAKAASAELAKLSGAEFDRAYIAREVAFHKAVLEAIDTTLIPGSQNAELKGAIAGVRPAIEAHLKHAEHLAAGLK